MVSGATSIFLKEKEILRDQAGRQKAGSAKRASRSVLLANNRLQAPILRVPPFPGAGVNTFAEVAGRTSKPTAVAAAMRALRVGGTYWGAQPDIPLGYVLVRSVEGKASPSKGLPPGPLVIWGGLARSFVDDSAGQQIDDDCDPWHVLSRASAFVTDADDETCLIAGLLGVPCYSLDPTSATVRAISVDVETEIEERLRGKSFENPFTGEPMDALAAVELCGFWRRLIDSNRGIEGGAGFAFWKQSHVAPLLWSGSSQFRFLREAEGIAPGGAVAVWRSKTPPALMSELRQREIALVDVEDGFLRSRGLGADCIPPLSITLDRLGAHFDPSRPSELENLLQDGQFDFATIERAAKLRQLIVEAAIGKYERGGGALERRVKARRHILVPGQVEDDRAVVAGGCGLVSNLELLRRVREKAPDAYILYKPHPDVLAGHRRGVVTDRACLEYADEIVGELPIASLIDMVDEVHVNTSLTGFEALLRGKSVTTHGVPFYAGWGLTCDLGPVPERRTSVRTLDELVAATLLLYPRYFDPVTRLPCPAEVVVARLSVDEASNDGLTVGIRRLQGKFMRRLRSLVQ